MDDIAALRLMMDWGADEALGNHPVSRLSVPAAALSASAGLPALPAVQIAVSAVPAAQLPVDLSTISTVAALYDAWANFDGCPLRATATSTVRPSGTVGARLLLLGDAPSADDDRSGAAFAGGTGAVVDRVLESVGLDRSRVLLAHCVPWRPPGNRPPSDPEMRACLPFVHRLLRLSGATHIVLMGQAACRMLLGTDARLSRLRGRWEDTSIPDGGAPMSAMAMAPAETWLRTANSRRETWSDLVLLRSTIDTTD